MPGAAAVIVGDYGKGVVTETLLNELKSMCRARGLWLSLDPKPLNRINLAGLSLAPGRDLYAVIKAVSLDRDTLTRAPWSAEMSNADSTIV